MRKKKILTPLKRNIPSATLNKSKKGGEVNLKSPMGSIERDKKIITSSSFAKFKINFNNINEYMQNKTNDVEELGGNEQSPDNVDLLFR